MKHQLRAFLAAFLAVLGTTLASALTVLPPAFPELVAHADTIARTTVVARRCEMRTTPHGPAIFTIITVRVETRLKGAGAETIQLEQLGGTVGDERMVIPGLPEFMPGDRDILFIAANGRAFCPLVAAPHGRYPLVADAKSGLTFVGRANGEPLVSTAAVSEPLHRHAAAEAAHDSEAPLTLEQFEAAIRAEVARQSSPLAP